MEENIDDILFAIFKREYEIITSRAAMFSIDRQNEIKRRLKTDFHAKLNQNNLKIIKSI